MQSAIIQTKQLNYRYSTKGDKPPIIKLLDLNIKEGDFTIIMGKSGSGKSTLLYLLSGLDQPSEGNVFFQNEPLGTFSEDKRTLVRRRSMGFVFQNSNLVPNLSLLENVLIAAYINPVDRKAIKKKALDLFKEFSVEQQMHQLPAEVSGGEQQRCAIIRAIINQPKVLFADEPTGSLNFHSSEQVLSAFHRLHTSGQSIVMVTHDIRAACMGNRILFFRDGDVVDEFHFNKEMELKKREKELTNWLLNQGW